MVLLNHDDARSNNNGMVPDPATYHSQYNLPRVGEVVAGVAGSDWCLLFTLVQRGQELLLAG